MGAQTSTYYRTIIKDGRKVSQLMPYDYRQLVETKSWSIDEAWNEYDSDCILDEAGHFNRVNKDCYTERQFRQQRDSTNASMDNYDPQSVPDCDYVNDLAVYQLRELAVLSGKWCSVKQSRYIRLMCAGWSFTDVGHICGVDESTVRESIRAGAERIAKRDPYFGLYELIARACGVSVSDAKYYARRVQ
jgi:hypothetical protein